MLVLDSWGRPGHSLHVLGVEHTLHLRKLAGLLGFAHDAAAVMKEGDPGLAAAR